MKSFSLLITSAIVRSAVASAVAVEHLHPRQSANHPTAPPNTTAPVWNGTAPVWNGTHPVWNGTHPVWNGTHPVWNGTAPVWPIRYKGCYADFGSGNRVLDGHSVVSENMTTEMCNSFCNAKGYTLAGTEYSSECYCGLTLGSDAKYPDTQCSSPCAGKWQEFCGGPDRLSVYENPNNKPTINPGSNGYLYQGCYTDNVLKRSLTYVANVDSPKLTVSMCNAACGVQGYLYAGVEYFGECYCGNELSPGAMMTNGTNSGCDVTCNGNSSEICGGPDRLSVYKATM